MVNMDLTLLIAEHDSELREALTDYFSRCGFHVAAAADGMDCLSRLQTTEPDVLLLDWDVFWGGGDGVLECVQQNHSRRDMPAVVITGSAPRGTLFQQSGVPHSCCFSKPVEPTDLMEGVELAVAMRDMQLM